MGTAVVRLVLVAIALLAGAWIVLSLHSVELESEGQAVAARAQREPITADELNRGRSLLQRARRFSADQGPRLVEAVLLDSAGRPGQAAAVAERVVEEEPDNFDAWMVLYLALIDLEGEARDTGQAAEALRTLRGLNPLSRRVIRAPG